MPSRLGEPAHDGRPCSHPVDLPSARGNTKHHDGGTFPVLSPGWCQERAVRVSRTKRASKGPIRTARYGVKVENTDAVDPLTLSALNDDQFGDITKDKNSTPVAKVDLRG